MAGGITWRDKGPSSVVGMQVEQEAKPKRDETEEQATVLGEEEASVVEKEDATQIAGVLQDLAQMMDRRLQFKVDERSGDLTIKVTNSETGEVIREIPHTALGGISQEQYDSGAGLIFSGIV